LVAATNQYLEELARIERYRKNLHQLVDLACSADAQKLRGNKQAKPELRCRELVTATMEYEAKVLGLSAVEYMLMLMRCFQSTALVAIKDVMKGGKGSAE
jgi:hypothetical protein